MMKRFENRVVVVTGGARGIGRAAAERFAREGARVALLDVDRAAAEETAEMMGGSAFHCDVADKESVQEAMRAVAERWEQLDVLFANAGVYRGGALTELTLEAWQIVMDVNLTGVMLSCQAVAPTMMAQKSGSIVIMSSMAAKTSWAETAAYSAAKTGAIGLMRSIARELGPYNINCNAVCLGHADTEMLRDVDERVCVAEGWQHGTYLERLVDENPMQRLCNLQEVAGLVAYLASDEARYINGQAIEIDGGLILS